MRRAHHEAQRYWAERDPEANSKSTPSEDEQIRLRSIWLVEVYTPSTITSLLKGLVGLRSTNTWTERDSPETWVRSQRRQAGAFGFLNVGWIPTSGHEVLPDTANLAETFDGVYVRLVGGGPSLTLLVAGFILREPAALLVDRALRQEYKTYSTPLSEGRRGWMEHPPESQKRDAFFMNIDSTRKQAEAWMRGRFPGTFAQSSDGSVPGMAVLTTTIHVPFSNVDGSGLVHNWAWITQLDREFEAWQSQEMPGWRLVPQLCWNDESGFLLLAGRQGDIADEEKLHGYGNDYHAIDYWLLNRAIGHLGPWGIMNLLHWYQSEIAGLRDVSVKAWSKGRVLAGLEETRKRIQTILSDARIVLHDVKQISAEKRLWMHESIPWEMPVAELRRNFQHEPLLEVWRQRTAWHAKRLDFAQRSLHDVLAVDASLRSTISNLRLQSSLYWLTVIILILTGAAVVIGVLQLLGQTIGGMKYE